MSNFEIERKFLVHELPLLEAIGGTVPACCEIKQGYLSTDDPEQRIRMKASNKTCEYTQTVKFGTGLQREEREWGISWQLFDQLWPLTEGKRIEKIRYEIPLVGLTAELDVYQGSNKGLIVVEVEFPDYESSKAFVPPPWFGEEVTENPVYKNKNLAK